MVFQVENVSCQLDGKPMLSDVQFSVREGERVVVLGVNGAGKSTLLKLLDGLLFPDSGSVSYQQTPLTPSGLVRGPFRRRFRSEVAMLFQNVDAMLFNPTVYDELAFGPRQLGLSDLEQRVHKWAETFGIKEMLPLAPFQLSGGEKKRVALAAIMAIEPKVLLLDEPTANLDPKNSAQLIDLLISMPQLTVVTSTHNLSLAEELGSRAIVLSAEHRLLCDRPTREFCTDEHALVTSGLSHRHLHTHGALPHVHHHLHDLD